MKKRSSPLHSIDDLGARQRTPAVVGQATGRRRYAQRMPRAALGALDALLGFEKVIEATWFFSERIEPASLHTSLSRLASRYPLLASHVGRRPGRLCDRIHSASGLGRRRATGQ